MYLRAHRVLHIPLSLRLIYLNYQYPNGAIPKTTSSARIRVQSQDLLSGLRRRYGDFVITRFFHAKTLKPVDLEGPAEHNVSRVPLDHINIAHNNLRLAPKSLQCTKSNTDLLSMGTTRPRKNSGTGAKPSLPAIRILKDWVQDHARHPYPTELEREELKVKTGLRKDQISNWLANARRRGKVPTPTPSSSSNRRRVEGPVPYAASTPIDIPMWGDSQPNSTLNPLDR